MVRRYGTASRMRECRSLSETVPWGPTNSLGPTRSIFGSLVVHASLPKGRDVAPSVPWLMLSWTGVMVALATLGQPVVTLHPWHICLLRATRALSRKLELRLSQRSRVLGTCLPLEICAVLGTCLPLEVCSVSLAHVFLSRFMLSFTERLLGCLLDPSRCTCHHFAS